MKLTKKSPKKTTQTKALVLPEVEEGNFTEDALELDNLDDVDAEATESSPQTELMTIVVPESHDGERLDKVLAHCLPDYSRSRLQSWIEQGLVTHEGQPTKIRQPIFGGDILLVQAAPLAEDNAFVAEPVELDVVYEDNDLLVINKPAGLVVHPGAGNWQGTILNGLLHRYAQSSQLPRAGIVHRLDKETSGLMVIAKNLVTQTHLVRQLQDRSVKRTYLALVWGKTLPNGSVDAPIGRDKRDRTRMGVVHGLGGKMARTHYLQLDCVPLAHAYVSMVRCQLETGRTHQIRVHMESIGHPLLGDPVYTRVGRGVGKAPLPEELSQPFKRQALHAYRLALLHPKTGELMQWQAEIPEDLRELCEVLDLPTEDFDDSARYIS